MNSLRELARGQPCFLRLPGCPCDKETVVLAHIRRGGTAGVGMKPSDLAAIPMDFYCHERFDSRIPSHHSRAQMDADALRGLCQWLSWLEKNGHITTEAA